jgi:hypothetical protein
MYYGEGKKSTAARRIEGRIEEEGIENGIELTVSVEQRIQNSM